MNPTVFEKCTVFSALNTGITTQFWRKLVSCVGWLVWQKRKEGSLAHTRSTSFFNRLSGRGQNFYDVVNQIWKIENSFIKTGRQKTTCIATGVNPYIRCHFPFNISTFSKATTSFIETKTIHILGKKKPPVFVMSEPFPADNWQIFPRRQGRRELSKLPEN